MGHDNYRDVAFPWVPKQNHSTAAQDTPPIQESWQEAEMTLCIAVS